MNIEVNLKNLNFQLNTLNMIKAEYEQKKNTLVVSDLNEVIDLLTRLERKLSITGDVMIRLDMLKAEANKQVYGRRS